MNNELSNTVHDAVLSIQNLHVDFSTNDGVISAVRGIDAQVHAGECLGIVGESGSGKSQTFLAAMGLLAANARVSGQVDFQGQNLLELPLNEINRIRGDRIAMIFQDPLTCLTPHMRIGEQMSEVLQVHKGLTSRDAMALSRDGLDKVRMTDAPRRLAQYPHELSGGMRQRVMIAMAMLCEPALLVADEPTTALDVTIQAEILDLIDQLRRDHGTAVVLITHDMGVVARMCDRVQVMRHGLFVEQGRCNDIFYQARHDYTRMLLDAVPRINPLANRREPPYAIGESTHPEPTNPEPTNPEPNDHETPTTARDRKVVLQVSDLHVGFAVNTGWFSKPQTLKAVDGISFDLNAGETLGIVGESGSGKSTLARAILRLIEPTAGVVSWMGTDVGQLGPEAMKQMRQNLQIVFQDPLASLNPSMTIGDSIAEPLRVFEPGLNTRARSERISAMMQRVGLDYALINRYPHELSGGQNQRVGIARAMILKPKLLICDEAVSALDVSIQAQIITLLKDLQREFGLSLIFISHDLSVVWDVSHRILVMYLGSVVELAKRDDLFAHPQHPYTQQLISAVPVPDPKIEKSRQRIKLYGELVSPMEKGAQLRFLRSRRSALSADYAPVLSEKFPGHFVAEHDSLDSLTKP